MLISVVVSFRNEAANLPELIRRLEAVFARIEATCELIFVNDASTDESLQILLEARARNPAIKIVNMSRRFGVTPCVLAGFEKARGDAVVCLDADLQDPPELIPDLIDKWRGGADVVHTTRTARRGENPVKLLLTRAAYWMINRFSDIEILQNTGDFKLLSRRVLDELLRLDEFDPFLRGLVSWVGFKQAQVFYVREPRFAGTTKFSLLTTLNPYKEFIRGITLFSTTPLYIALFLGLFVSGLSFLFLLVLVGAQLIFGRDAALSWNHVLLGAILLMGGMILFTVGILGMYVGRIHRETINRPRYIIREFIGGD